MLYPCTQVLLYSSLLPVAADVQIDGAGLRAWFDPLYEDYCKTMSLPCGAGKKSGCGINDDCRLEQACLDKEDGTFSCIGKIASNFLDFLNFLTLSAI